jgi:hypothetical protein
VEDVKAKVQEARISDAGKMTRDLIGIEWTHQAGNIEALI